MTTDTIAAPASGRRPLRQALGDNWLLFLLRGIAAIAFGVLSLFWPGLSLATLVLLFGAYAIVDGVLSLFAAVSGRTGTESRWWLALVGVLGIAAGVLTFLWPGITALILLFMIGGWAIASGIFQIVGAIRLRKEIDNEWLLVFDGVISVLFGLALIVIPSAGALAMIWMIAVYAVLFGIVTIAFALKVRKYRSGA